VNLAADPYRHTWRQTHHRFQYCRRSKGVRLRRMPEKRMNRKGMLDNVNSRVDQRRISDTAERCQMNLLMVGKWSLFCPTPMWRHRRVRLRIKLRAERRLHPTPCSSSSELPTNSESNENTTPSNRNARRCRHDGRITRLSHGIHPTSITGHEYTLCTDAENRPPRKRPRGYQSTPTPEGPPPLMGCWKSQSIPWMNVTAHATTPAPQNHEYENK
jgi:hypothetical protein